MSSAVRTSGLPEQERLAYLNFLATIEVWSKLGSRVHKDGTREIGHIPHRAPEAYLHVLFVPLDMDGIGELQRRIGQNFPDSLIRFLTTHNGTGVFTSYVNIYGLRRHWVRSNIDAAITQPFSMVEENVECRPSHIPEGMIVIGSLGDQRDRVVVMANGEVTVRQERPSGFAPVVYPNVFEFLLLETRKASTLFDYLGRRWDGSDSRGND